MINTLINSYPLPEWYKIAWEFIDMSDDIAICVISDKGVRKAVKLTIPMRFSLFGDYDGIGKLIYPVIDKLIDEVRRTAR